jgi:ligand-binding sensor domain-containing protein
MLLVATDREVLVVNVERGASAQAHGISDRPTCLAADSLVHGCAWCGTHGGVFRSDDGGTSWQAVGLAGKLVMTVAASPVQQDLVWVGTEPSEVWRSEDAGNTWEQTSRLERLLSASEWSFTPRGRPRDRTTMPITQPRTP